MRIRSTSFSSNSHLLSTLSYSLLLLLLLSCRQSNSFVWVCGWSRLIPPPSPLSLGHLLPLNSLSRHILPGDAAKKAQSKPHHQPFAHKQSHHKSAYAGRYQAQVEVPKFALPENGCSPKQAYQLCVLPSRRSPPSDLTLGLLSLLQDPR
jgi:hypothetical protein